MALTPGTRFGSFEITSLLGAGGMGEVYAALDTRLDRRVAIKVLLDSFARDPERLARFEREAKLLATLNHPRIAQIYGLEESASTGSAHAVRGLVMELVEGPTLADRIAQGPIPLDEALPIARQIAEALEAAHEQGIVHRDLKPANIKVRPDGSVTVLDFGLAKLNEAGGAGEANVDATVALTMSPTALSPAMTQAGFLLGTAAYMSPEQARGRPAGKRADVWAFGCVLYEMLTGRRAFPGADLPETIAAVIKSEPDWNVVPSDVPAAIRTLLRRCLEKDASERVGGMAAVRFVLTEHGVLAPRQAAQPAQTARGLRPLPAMALMLAVGAIGAAIATYVRWQPVAPEVRLDVTADNSYQFGADSSYALSPDGSSIVFAAAPRDKVSQLWLRRLASPDATPLPGTERGTLPFWSPDGRSIGFFSDSALKRIGLIDRSTQTLATMNYSTGGAWAPDGTILFVPTTTSPVMAYRDGKTTPLPAETGAPAQRGPQAGSVQQSPVLLPDGQQFLFFVPLPADARGIYVGARDGRARRKLLEADSPAGYVDAGWIFYLKRGTLFAQRFDVSSAAISGEPVVVAETTGSFSVSRNGVIAYRAERPPSVGELRWFNRDGGAIRELPTLAPGTNPVIHSDGRVVWDRGVSGNRDVWIFDGTRSTRLTSDGAVDFVPNWRGDRVVFSSGRRGALDLYEAPVNDPNAARLIDQSDTDKLVSDVSPDGRSVAFQRVNEGGANDIWTVGFDDSGSVAPFVSTGADERNGLFSPDGRWMAYQSDESGRNEIYVRRFPAQAGAGRQQVSIAGGVWPRWSRDGRELYYVDPSGAMMVMAVTRTGDALGFAAPVILFKAVFPTVDSRIHAQYDVDRRGRFLMVTAPDGTPLAPIRIILNWKPAL